MKTGTQIKEEKFEKFILAEYEALCNKIDAVMIEKGILDKELSKETGVAAYRIGLLRKCKLSLNTTMYTVLKITTHLGIRVYVKC
jgi:DNA-binding Xre family transcriptional regulator